MFMEFMNKTNQSDANIKTHISYHPDGKQKLSETEWLNGKRHGKFLRWYENGDLEEACTWKYGQRHGQYNAWFPFGVKKEESKWYHGLCHGQYKRWVLTGSTRVLVEKSNWICGQKEGLYQEWNDYNIMIEESNWLYGRKHGRCRVWSRYGLIVEDQEYICGYTLSSVRRIVQILRKAKWYRLARITKTRAFCEWWYHPDNPGGKLLKKRLGLFIVDQTVRSV